MKEHVELVNKTNDETNSIEGDLSKSKDLIIYEEQVPAIKDKDRKTCSVAELIDMDLPELIKLLQKVPDLKVDRNFFNFLYHNYKDLRTHKSNKQLGILEMISNNPGAIWILSVLPFLLIICEHLVKFIINDTKLFFDLSTVYL